MVPKQVQPIHNKSDIKFLQDKKPNVVLKKPIDEYLTLYEKRRMEYENMKTLDFVDGGDPLIAAQLTRAI